MSSSISIPAPQCVPGLLSWYSALNPLGDRSIPANNTALSAWTPRFNLANAFIASQATGANQPVFNTNIINGLPTLTFNVLKTMQVSHINSLQLTGQFSMYVVLALANTNANQAILSKGNSASDPDYCWILNRTATGMVSFYNGTAWVDSTANYTNTTSFTILALTWNGSTYTFYANGAQLGSAVSNSTALQTSTQNLVIGAQGATSLSNIINGQISELLIYNGTHSSTQITNVYRYFGNLYGLLSL